MNIDTILVQEDWNLYGSNLISVALAIAFSEDPGSMVAMEICLSVA